MRIRVLHFIFLSFLCTALFSSRVFAWNCVNFLKKSSVKVRVEGNFSNSTRGLIAYLDFLLEKKLIGEFELARLIKSIEAGSIENPIEEMKAELDSELYEHYLGLEEYRGISDLELSKVLDWARSKLKKEERVKKERSTVRKETEEITWQMEFVMVLPGEFMMGEGKKKLQSLLKSCPPL